MADTKPLTRAQIVAHLAEKFDISKKTAGEIVTELAELAYAETKARGEFTIPGIGKLVRQERAARSGRNPKTGEQIAIPASTVVRFRLAKAAKDAVLPTKAASKTAK